MIMAIIASRRELLLVEDEPLWERCFQKWENRWNRCIAAQGEYFEGDNFK
jgi:hypothetical protein